ncbi:MAG: cell division protein FtsK [Bacilli bacterium]|nr:cell division protein FtsK [Bacilli bacterium]
MRRVKARRKTKKQQANSWIKVEISGLVVLTLTVLAIARLGPVGEGINYLFILLAGNYYISISLFIIYIAAYLMVKQFLPPFGRRTKGILILWAVTLGWSTLNLYQAIHVGQSHQESSLLQGTWVREQNLYAALAGNAPSTSNIPDANLPAGGLIGVGVFTLFDSLFDIGGTLFFFITLLVIGGILVTGVSFATIWDIVSSFLYSRFREIRDGFAAIRQAPGNKPHVNAPQHKSTRTHSVEGSTVQMQGQDASGAGHAKASDATADQLLDEPVFPNVKPLTIRDFSELVQTPPAVQEGAIQLAASHSGVVVKFPVAESANAYEGEEFPFAALPAQLEPPLYVLPSLSLLDAPKTIRQGKDRGDIEGKARKLEATLESFGVQVKVTDVYRGPTVTRYELSPAVGVKVSSITRLSDDIALSMAAKDIRIEAPIPGKSAVGIEVPNAEIAIVTLREVLESPEFRDSASKLSVALGRDISGKPIVGNLAKMPHILVAGATGSGKSVCINGIIVSILVKAKPHEVKFIMIDPKMVELNVYNGIPHLMAPVVTDPRRAAYALKKVVTEMELRYELFSKQGARNMEGYNLLMAEQQKPLLPLIVVIIDELADLMMVAPGDVEDAICRLAQMARAAGIHLIIATQRPSVDVITGVIKANIPSRIAFAVSSQVDSRTILDGAGAEKLLGRGDMLYMPIGESKPIRIQGAFLSDGEVERMVSYAKDQTSNTTAYTLDLSVPPDSAMKPEEELDTLFWEAVKLVVDHEQASVSLLQRRLKIGYSRAARLIDQMQDQGIVGQFEGSKPREVLLSKEQWESQFHKV